MSEVFFMDNFRAMEVVATFSSNPEAVKKLIVASFVESVIVDFLLATRRSIACFFVVAGVLLKNEDELLNLIGADHRFPMDELHRKERPGPENVDGSDTEDNDDEDDDADQDDDDGDEDFSGEDGGEDDEEGDPVEDPVANGNDGSEDDKDEDDEDGDEDEDGEDDEDEDDEDEDEEDAPPAKKRK